jgi:hypothetical protein
VDVHLAGQRFTVTSLTWDAPGKGHDRLLVVDEFVGVSDGATPLTVGAADPGSFAAAALSALRASAAGSDLQADQMWRQAIVDARLPSVDPGRHPSCSVVAVRGRGRTLEFGRLGDCTALITLTDGRIVRLLDSVIAGLDARALRSPWPARALRRNRARANTADGYWIFAADEAAAAHVETTTFSSEDVAGFALFSDGLPTLARAGSSVDDLAVLVAQRRPAGHA